MPAATSERGEAGRAEARGWRAVDAIWLAAAMGLLVGLVEVAGLGWRAAVRGRLTRVTPDVFWMSPTVYLGLFLILATVLVVSGLARARERPGPTVLLLATLGVFGGISLGDWPVHGLAVLVLSAGIAVQLARLANRHASGLAPVAKPAALALCVAVVATAALRLGAERRTEERLFAQLPEPAGDAPNVLLLILDTVRAKSLGLYGGSEEVSPTLDALASSSIVFDRAISPAPWTLPSHASMFTGRWPHELTAGWDTPLDAAAPTLAEVLSARGYATAGFVANLLYTSGHMGIDRGFVRYEDYPRTLGQAVLATGLGREVATSDALRRLLDEHELLNRKTASDLRRDVFRWLDGRPPRPFFVFMNFFDAHEPYEPPPDVRERFGVADYRRQGIHHAHELLRGVSANRERRWETSDEEAKKELALYEAAIAALDSELAALLGGLRERGLLDTSVLIITADHGEQMGEHGLFGHLQSLYRPLTHVPLLIRLPGGAHGGVRVDRPLSLRDLPATILDLVPAGDGALPGGSLATLWDPERPMRVSRAVSQLERGLVEQPWYPIAPGLAMQSMVSGTLHYICNPDATEELYDLSRDPEERFNLAGTEPGAAAVREFRGRIGAIGAPPRSCPPLPEDPPRLPASRP